MQPVNQQTLFFGIANMTKPYSSQQIIFALNSMANAPSGLHGTVREFEEFAQNVITATLDNGEVKQLVGEWKLVWGPAVYQVHDAVYDSTVADNSMYVAQSVNEPTCFVVAISGTNPISMYGWICEDLMINPPQSWRYSTDCPSQAKISNGTQVGLDALLDMRSGGKTLIEYLKGQTVSVLTVTGHSLGGALSPALALALKNLQSQWDVTSTAKIAVMPTAGPTPGNKAWADYYDLQLGKTTDRLWNALDIVPHAWELDMLSELPTLYEPYIPKSDLVVFFVQIAEANSRHAGDMWQIRHDVRGLSYQVQLVKATVEFIRFVLDTLKRSDLLEKIFKQRYPDSFIAMDDHVEQAGTVVRDLIRSIADRESDESISRSELISIMRENNQMRSRDCETRRLVESFIDQLLDFILFLAQAVYQHTSAYAEIIGTKEFACLYSYIRTHTVF